MSEPTDPSRSAPDAPASGSDSPPDFDPYRFGKPDHPIPPEYAPPGYVPPANFSAEPAGPSLSKEPRNGAAGGGYQPMPPYAPPSGYPWQGSAGGQGHPPYNYPPAPQGGNYPPYGAGPYGGAPYGQRPGAGGRGNGKATAALVLGILSIVLCFLSFFDLILVVLAIVFGILGRKQSDSIPGQPGRGAATAGLICGIVGAVLVAALIVLVVTRYSSCFTAGNVNSAQQCIRNTP